MTVWTLDPKRVFDEPVDGSTIMPQNFRGKRESELARLAVGPMVLEDLFDIAINPIATAVDQVVIRGDIRNIHHIGARMSSGEILVDGSVGDFLGAAVDRRRVGMTGGRIVVCGSAGSNVGHRMRRGEIWIAGDAGRFTAAHMVAGTIVVAGKNGADPALGMRRGSLFVARMPALSKDRFSRSIEQPFLMGRLITPPPIETLVEYWQRFTANRVFSRRGDRSVGGQAEILSLAE